MHRRAVQCVADLRLHPLKNRISSSNTQCQKRNRSGATATKRKAKQQNKTSPAQLADHWTRLLINAAAEGEERPGWSHVTGRVREEARLSAEVVGRTGGTAAVITPVKEEHQVFSAPADEDGDVEVLQDYKHTYYRPGAFVILKRNYQEMHAVVLFRYMVKAAEMAFSLTSSGACLGHYVEDVVHALPDFIDSTLAARCGREEAPQSKIEHSARVTVLKRLRDMEHIIEGAQAAISRNIGCLYALVKSPKPNEWSEVTLDQAIRLVPTSPKYQGTIHAMGVHRALLDRSFEFQAASVYESPPMRFYVRPQEHVDTIKKISAIVRTASDQDGPMQIFAAKARKIITASRERAVASWTEPPSARRMDSAVFDSTDLTILTFLRRSIRKTRKIQPDPYALYVSIIIRTIGLYNDTQMDRGAELVLEQLGLLAPWESAEAEPRGLLMDYMSTKPKDERFLPLMGPKDVIPSPSSTTAASKPMGLDDLYTHDPVESIRHDFGDLPVYVIDDVDAKELDDGISVEPLSSEPGCAWVHVHIADPTSVLPPTHRISADARDKVFTAYYVQRTVPLLGALPQLDNLSLGVVSATGRPEPVMTFSFKSDAHGNILDYKVRAGMVRNVRRMSYEEVDRTLDFQARRRTYPFGEPEWLETSFVARRSVTEADKENLLALRSIADGLFDHARRSGIFVINNGYATISTSNALPPSPDDMTTPVEFRGFPTLKYAVEEYVIYTQGARRIVSECMKAACRVASRFGKEHNIPLMRRMQPQPVTPTEAAFQDLLNARDEDLVVSYTDILRTGVSPASGRYVLEPAQHWFVGASADEGYVRVTSPLRRYYDLVSHWQLKHALMPSCPAFSLSFMEQLLKEVDYKTKTHMKSEREHTFNWALKFIQRWQKDPRFANERRKNDILENLTGQIQDPPSFSQFKGTSMTKIYVHELAIHGYLVHLRRAAVDYVVGETIPVRMEPLDVVQASELMFTER